MPKADEENAAAHGPGVRRDPDEGCGAPTPAHIPTRRWWLVLQRCAWQVFAKRLLGEAAAVAFYALLAALPALAALVTLCGLVIDPGVAAASLQTLTSTLPAGSAEVARDTLERLGSSGGGRIALAATLVAAALWSVTAASLQLLGALNVAYGEREERSLVHLVGTALLFALGTMVFVGLALGGVLGLPLVLGAQTGLGSDADRLLRLLRWPVLFVLVSAALAIVYRHGPSRTCPRWGWVSWGGAVAACAWLLGSACVSWYMQWVGRYDWLYGAVGSVLGLMLWAWVSAAAILLGAVLNAELEREGPKSDRSGLPYPDLPSQEWLTSKADDQGPAPAPQGRRYEPRPLTDRQHRASST